VLIAAEWAISTIQLFGDTEALSVCLGSAIISSTTQQQNGIDV